MTHVINHFESGTFPKQRSNSAYPSFTQLEGRVIECPSYGLHQVFNEQYGLQGFFPGCFHQAAFGHLIQDMVSCLLVERGKVFRGKGVEQAVFDVVEFEVRFYGKDFRLRKIGQDDPALFLF